MHRSLLAATLAAALALSACDTASDDPATQADTLAPDTLAADTLAPDTLAPDAGPPSRPGDIHTADFIDDSAIADAGPGDDAGAEDAEEDLPPEEVAEPAPRWSMDIAPIFAAACATCHTTKGFGGHNNATTYGDNLKNAKTCPGQTVGECSLTRIKDGTMPPSGAKLPAASVALIEAWVAAGMPE